MLSPGPSRWAPPGLFESDFSQVCLSGPKRIYPLPRLWIAPLFPLRPAFSFGRSLLSKNDNFSSSQLSRIASSGGEETPKRPPPAQAVQPFPRWLVGWPFQARGWFLLRGALFRWESTPFEQAPPPGPPFSLPRGLPRLSNKPSYISLQ